MGYYISLRATLIEEQKELPDKKNLISFFFFLITTHFKCEMSLSSQDAAMFLNRFCLQYHDSSTL